MATRRPLVRAAGRTRQLPAGDTLAGIPIYVPAYQRSGAALKLLATITYGIAVTTRGGATLNVQAVLNG